MTDDSVLTLAVAKVLMNNYPIDYSEQGLEKIKKELVNEFVATCYEHPNAGYGGMFYDWLRSPEHKPYNSYGNGSAMRISPVGWIANSEEEVKKLSKAVSEITHNHPKGIKGAEAIAMCIFLARNGVSKTDIKKRMIKEYYPEIVKLNYQDLLENYDFDETCPGSVPQAIYLFLISKDLEDTYRTCVAVGGDTDTIACMAGSIAEAYYQKDVLSPLENKFIYMFFDRKTENFIKSFYQMIGNPKFNK